MKAIQLAAPGGLDNLNVAEVDEPGSPGPGQLKVRAHASSLNFHDYMVVAGNIKTEDKRVPMSDVSGEVVELGEGVTDFAVGDQVIGTFFPRWQSGPPEGRKTFTDVPGDSSEGYAQEFVVNADTAFTHAPRGWSHEEAATLPCAGVTAWRSLIVEAKIKPGDVVLTQGSGGVSVYALQIARAAGCTVISTSSSDEKLQKLKELGADHLINYKQEEDWGKKAKEITGGKGVDHVVEVGGAGTLAQSIDACKVGGSIGMIGVLTGAVGKVPTIGLIYGQVSVYGIAVGSRRDQADMVKAMNVNGIKPVIDKSYPLEEIAEAFRYQESQKHFGKICLSY